MIERKKIVSERDSKVKQEVMSLLGEGCRAGKLSQEKKGMRREEDTERGVVTTRPKNIRSVTEIEALYSNAPF